MASYAQGKKAWGICARCGQRALLNDLVFDGYYPSLRVHERCYESRHPQDRLVALDDPVALWRPSPEDYPIIAPILTGALMTAGQSEETLVITAGEQEPYSGYTTELPDLLTPLGESGGGINDLGGEDTLFVEEVLSVFRSFDDCTFVVSITGENEIPAEDLFTSIDFEDGNGNPYSFDVGDATITDNTPRSGSMEESLLRSWEWEGDPIFYAGEQYSIVFTYTPPGVSGIQLVWSSGTSEHVRLNRYRVFRAIGETVEEEDFEEIAALSISYDDFGKRTFEPLEFLDEDGTEVGTYHYYVIFDDDVDRNRPFSVRSNIITILVDFIPPGPPVLSGELVLGPDVPPAIANIVELGELSGLRVEWNAAEFSSGAQVAEYQLYRIDSDTYSASPSFSEPFPTIDDMVLIGSVDGGTLELIDSGANFYLTRQYAYIVRAVSDDETPVNLDSEISFSSAPS